MEAMKMKVFVVLMVVLMAFSTMQKATAAEAPAPSPASDATIFVPCFLGIFCCSCFWALPLSHPASTDYMLFLISFPTHFSFSLWDHIS
ncbi:ARABINOGALACTAN PEPTIDE 1 [Salix koriyanagi]|uniref:ARABINOGALACTAN PEPTIDE 1 n=1 Tax=Salix koriyanagi TaxID=2511006 RepID=A0A9Q0PUA4_9ROSI|nr:ARABINOGALACTAN PEPTIDE 1 [Salix koriyanagi]